MSEKKYELVKEDEIYVDGRNLYRIRALKDFNNVKKGYIGGYIESEENLSNKGNCWIYDDAIVYDKARVTDNAAVTGDAVVKDMSRVTLDAIIRDKCVIEGNSFISNTADVNGDVKVNNSIITGNCSISGAGLISNSEICDDAEVVVDLMEISNSKICENSVVRVLNERFIIKEGYIGKNAKIQSSTDYVVMNPIIPYTSLTIYSTDEGIMFSNMHDCMTEAEFRQYIVNLHPEDEFDIEDYEKKFEAIITMAHALFSVYNC